MKTIIGAVVCSLATTFLFSISAIAATCGHDVHGAPTIEVTELGENNSVLHYFSPATLVMDDTSHPAHRAFGECRGQGVTIDGVSNWAGLAFGRIRMEMRWLPIGPLALEIKVRKKVAYTGQRHGLEAVS